jgi:hypothetical protein
MEGLRGLLTASRMGSRMASLIGLPDLHVQITSRMASLIGLPDLLFQIAHLIARDDLRLPPSSDLIARDDLRLPPSSGTSMAARRSLSGLGRQRPSTSP